MQEQYQMYEKSLNTTIGIDLGTSKSCVGIWVKDRVKIISNELCSKFIPSYISFNDQQRYIGIDALNQITKNPLYTIFNVKNIIGRKFTDISVQNQIKFCSFRIEKGEYNTPLIVIKYKGQIKKFYPEQISAMILNKLKKIAEDHIGKIIQNAVISVPSSFNIFQKQSTKIAGQIAGMRVLRVINQPDAVGLAYTLDEIYRVNKSQRKILIFDLGAGKFNAAVFAFDQGVIEAKSTLGNSNLGGQDFNKRLLQYCMQDFKKKTQIDIKSNPKAIRKLMVQIQKAKCILSSSLQTTIEIQYLAQEQDFVLTISRKKFEQLCMDLFIQIMELTKKTIQAAITEYSKGKVDEYILVGGSSRIPKIVELMKKLFNGKQSNKIYNPQQAVASGASIMGGILSGNGSQVTDSLLLIAVTPFALGIESENRAMNVIIPKNTTIPNKKSTTISTDTDNQTEISIRIFQGQSNTAKENMLLGQIKLGGISKASKGVPQIEVCFQIDQNNITKVTVQDKSLQGRTQTIIVNKNDYHRSLNNQKLSQNIQKYNLEDDKLNKINQARKKLEQDCLNARQFIEKQKKINAFDNTKTLKKIEQIIDWVSNPIVDESVFQLKQKKLKEFITECQENRFKKL